MLPLSGCPIIDCAREAILAEILAGLWGPKPDQDLQVSAKLGRDLGFTVLCQLFVGVNTPWDLIFPDFCDPAEATEGWNPVVLCKDPVGPWVITTRRTLDLER